MMKIAKISREDCYETIPSQHKRIDWLDEFASKMSKDATQINATQANPSVVNMGRMRGYDSITNQLYNIMNKKTNTVECLVQELQDKIGLTEYLKRISESKEDNTKTATPNPAAQKQAQDSEATPGSDPNTLDPNKIWEDVQEPVRNQMIQTMMNRIHDMPDLAVRAIQDYVIRMFKNDGVQPKHIDNNAAADFISKLKEEEDSVRHVQDSNYSNLGKSLTRDNTECDVAMNQDPFANMMGNTAR